MRFTRGVSRSRIRGLGDAKIRTGGTKPVSLSRTRFSAVRVSHSVVAVADLVSRIGTAVANPVPLLLHHNKRRERNSLGRAVVDVAFLCAPPVYNVHDRAFPRGNFRTARCVVLSAQSARELEWHEPSEEACCGEPR